MRGTPYVPPHTEAERASRLKTVFQAVEDGARSVSEIARASQLTDTSCRRAVHTLAASRSIRRVFVRMRGPVRIYHYTPRESAAEAA